MSTKLTAKEIISILLEKGIEINEFAYDDYETIEELGEAKEVEQVGGEGEGENWNSVKHFEKHDVYIRVDGDYSSYNGTDFRGDIDSENIVYEVFPSLKISKTYFSKEDLIKNENLLKEFKDKVIAEYLAK